uniref:Putative ribonuclease H-like domain-containing protein n=1 Tax=Tanacetum cinerariifolium TaxID=118510 RepID=A0A6L2KKZ8_TANCI|nr:putative ribonuclease H-like domain-containing protein [Tanacetum cinerariifolium]
MLVQVYVVDIIFGSTKKELCNALEKMMHQKFQMNSMGELTFFLGFQVKQKQDGIFISQDKYVAEILKKSSFLEVKNASTPMETQKPMLKDEDGEEVDVHMYRSMISSLMYLTSSRHDIMFAVCACARYQINPKPTKCEGFEQIVDFQNANPIKYALTVNLTVYTSCIEQFWSTVKAKTVNGEGQLQALVDGKKKFNFSKYIFESMVKNLDNVNKFLMYPRKPKRKDIGLPHTSVPTSVTDEVVNEEMDDNLERAAPTATSLDAEQDRGNISKTQSKATPNESGSQGTNSDGGPRCLEAMWDTVAQTRSEIVSKISNDPLLVGVNTPQSGEDSLKLTELMKLYTKLQQRVLDLETTKTTQAMQIESLKIRVKKLERRMRSRTHGLKRLYKFGLSVRVESSKDEGLGEEDASKQRRIADIDSNEDIYLVNVHKDKDIFGVNDSDSDEVIVEDAEMLFDVGDDLKVNVVSTATTTTAIIDDITLAKALMEIKSTKPKTIAPSTRPKAKRRVIHEQEHAPTSTVSSQQPSHVKDTGKGKMVEPEPVKKLSKKYKLKLNEELAFKQQAKEEEEERIAREKLKKLKKEFKKAKAEITQEGSSTRAGDEIEQERSKKQKVEDDKKSEELKKCLEIISNDGDDVTIDAMPLSFKSPTIVDYKIYKEGKKNYFQIFKANGNSQMYLTFSKMLKNFDREDLEVLWRLVKDIFKKEKPMDHMESFLLYNLKTMFEHHVKDNVWKNQQGLVKVNN